MPPKDPGTAAVGAWLADDFIASFKRDVDPSLWTDVQEGGVQHNRGFFAIAVLTLAHCDAMAGLMVGQASSDGTEKTVKFIETEVAGNAGEAVLQGRYEKRAAALFHIYRHGPSHQREPGVLQWDNVTVAWRLARGGPQAMHLKLTAGTPFYLHVDVDLLNAHVLKTFEAIRDRVVDGDIALARNIFNGATAASSSQEPRCGRGGHVGKKLSDMILSPDP